MIADMARAAAPLGGVLRCLRCGRDKPVGGPSKIGRYLTRGWPKCCGETMRWITQRELIVEGEEN
jgi:hypothetical protein